MSHNSKFFGPRSPHQWIHNRVWDKLRHWMEHHPVVSNSVLCLNLWVAGDILAQYSEHTMIHGSTTTTMETGDDSSTVLRSSSDTTKTTTSTTTTIDDKHWFQPLRLAQVATFGALVTGPLLAMWYPFLERTCKGLQLSQQYGVWGAPVAKVMADEFILEPPYLLFFFGYMTSCEHYGTTANTIWQQYQTKVQSEFLVTYQTSLMAWPAILLGTFRWVPVYAQAPWINLCCIVWDGFLSHRNALAKHKVKQQQQQQLLEESSQNNKNDESLPSSSSIQDDDDDLTRSATTPSALVEK